MDTYGTCLGSSDACESYLDLIVPYFSTYCKATASDEA
jgi:hypothetical protein